MGDSTNGKVPALFRIVAIAAVVWNILGVMAYYMDVTMSAEAIAALPEAQQALYAARPAWVTGAFAVAVFAGLAGSILLALRKNLAVTIFVISLAAVITQMSYVFAFSNSIDVMGAGSAAMPALITAIAAALVWFSMHAKNKGWTS